MNRPTRNSPNATWITPASMTMVKASAGLWACWVSTTIIATVMAAVEYAIRAGVPPKTAAKNPTAIAPYMPATGPNPVATP